MRKKFKINNFSLIKVFLIRIEDRKFFSNLTQIQSVGIGTGTVANELQKIPCSMYEHVRRVR